LEDETAASIKQRHSGVKPENFQAVMPLRPGYGTKGGGFTVFANYFELSTPKELSLHRYNMSILEVGTNKEPTGKKAKRVVQLLILQHFLADRARIVTDFRSNLFCKRALTLGEQPLRVVYWPEEEDEPDANATNVKAYNVKMVASGSVLVSSLIDHLASSRADATCATKDETLQALNILFGQHPKDVRNIFNIGASKHFPMNPDQADQHDLGAGLTAIRGYFMSVRPATGRLLVNVQVKHVPCLTPASLGLVIKQWQSSNSSQPARLSIFLKRVRVRVTHIKKTNKDGQTIDRIKTITGLAFPNDGAGTPHPPRVARLGAGPKEVEFWLEAAPGTAGGAGPSSPSTAKSKKPAASATGGKYISVYDFFRRSESSSWFGFVLAMLMTYAAYPNVRFNTGDENIPVVNVGTKERPSYLPAVVCEVMPGQASGAKLSSNQTAQMINFAVRQAGVNAASIVNAGANLLGFRSPNTPLVSYS
jgi:eukaryotic translation initiation factor 2C